MLNLKVLYTDPLFESLFSIVVKVTDPARFSLIHFCIDIIFSHLINSEFQYPFVLPGMTMKGLTFKIKALKQQAVFALPPHTTRNNTMRPGRKIHHRTQTNL